MHGVTHRRDLWKAIRVAGNAAEIGVAEGYFSADMLGWPIKFPVVYMVDRWRTVPDQKGDASNSQEWHEDNMRRAIRRTLDYGARAQVLRGNSVDMAKRVPDASLALVYVDGDHSYEGVLNDITAWLPKVAPGGVMAFHDYENPSYGVKDAVAQCGRTIHLLPEDKIEDAGAFFYADSL